MTIIIIKNEFVVTKYKKIPGILPVVQCLRCHAPNTWSPSSIPRRETRYHMPQLNPGQLNKKFFFGCVGSSLLCRLFSHCGKWVLLSSCGVWALLLQSPGSRGQAQKLWHVGSVATLHVESSLIMNQTHVSCTASRFFTT